MSSHQRKRTASRSVGRKKKTSRIATTKTWIARPFVRDLNVYDKSATISTNVANWVYTPLFLPTQGSTSSSRYGDKVQVFSIQYFIYLLNAPVLRAIVYYDRQPNGANPTSPAPMLTLDTEAFKDPDLRLRFKILRDFWIGNAGTSGPITSSDPRNNNMQRGLIKISLPVTFNGNAGTITDVTSGAIGIAVFNAATQASAMTVNFRTLFQS